MDGREENSKMTNMVRVGQESLCGEVTEASDQSDCFDVEFL